MGAHRWDDDDRLFEDLGAALRAAGPVPAATLAGGDAAYAWRTVDAELAALRYDSLLDRELLLRGSAPISRSLVFQGSTMSVDVELNDDALVGQLVPPTAGEVVLLGIAGELGRTSADELGSFTLAAPARGPIRLLCETSSGRLVTEWLRR